MGSCSSPELEPGPLEELKADPAVDTPLLPFAEKHATEFAARTSPFLSVLDAAYVALEAEQGLDLLGDIGDVGASFASVTAAAVNPEALAHLRAAEDGFRATRDQVASLLAGVPSDVQPPDTTNAIWFNVRDAGGRGIPGALITLDADFGTGTQRVTDGDGRATFALPTTGVIAYSVAAAGYVLGSGTVDLAGKLAVFITLQAA